MKYLDYEFYTDKKSMESLLFISISGAHAYGWSTKESDLDIREVTVPRIQQLISPFFQMKTKSWTEESLNGNKKIIDIVNYPIDHFLRLLNKGNGNTLDNLFQEKLIERTEEVKDLQDIVFEHLHQRFILHQIGYAKSIWHDLSVQSRLEKYGRKKLYLQLYKTLRQGIILAKYKEIVFNVIEQQEYLSSNYILNLLSNNKMKSQQIEEELAHLTAELVSMKDSFPEHSTLDIALDYWLRELYNLK